MTFRFRLERILLHRRRELDARTREAAAAESRLQEAVAAAEETAARLQESIQLAAEGRQGCLNAGSLLRQLAWHEVLCERCRTQDTRVEEARRSRDEARRLLMKAWQDREVLSQLKEKQQRDWAVAQARRERRTLDEVGAIRAAQAARGAVPAPATDPSRAGRRGAESGEA